jgi:DNA-directed RNA polymerase subunit RPC12/RpoP
MIVFSCHVCRAELSANDAQAGQLVRCRKCLTTLTVPAATRDDPAAALAVMQGGPRRATADSAAATASDARRPSAAVPPPAPPPPSPGYFPNRPAGRRYGFNCGFCSSRLEATESMAAQEGQCPTCGNNITIPILDRYGRLIDPKTNQIVKQDPHPVHAYAANGDRAPLIIRTADKKQAIQCSRCAGVSPITSNNCKGCGMPFTMEGTTLEAAGGSNGFAVASLVLGIIGIPSCLVLVPSILAIVFGIVALVQTNRAGPGDSTGGRGMAIAGVVLGVIGCVIALVRSVGL